MHTCVSRGEGRGRRAMHGFLFKKIKELQRKDREREREVFHLLFHSSNGHNGKAGLFQRLEPGASSASLMWVQGPKDLGHLLLLSQAC